MSFFPWFWSAPISEAEIRAEIWSLGTRHLGWPLEGARDELKAGNIPVEVESLSTSNGSSTSFNSSSTGETSFNETCFG